MSSKLMVPAELPVGMSTPVVISVAMSVAGTALEGTLVGGMVAGMGSLPAVTEELTAATSPLPAETLTCIYQRLIPLRAS